MIVSLAMSLVLSAPETILPGALDLPVIEGSRPSVECLGLRERLAEAGSPYACLETSYDAANDMVFAYKRSAEQAGWTSDGGAANALWLRRTAAEGKCQRLTLAAFPGTEGGAQPRAADIIFAMDPDVRCPRPTTAP